jgi:polysaccharide biosynthesis/export protein
MQWSGKLQVTDLLEFLMNLMSHIAKVFQIVLLISAGNCFAQSVLDYELGGGDSIKTSVFLSPELTAEVRLSEDGLVSLPMIGQIKLLGLTVPQAEALIATKLKEGNFIQKAQVSVAVVAYRSKQVSVLGSVGKPGRYPLEFKGIRLSEMLAMAGGIAGGGDDKIILTRKNKQGKVESAEIDLPSIYLNNRQELDIELIGGDTLYVHRQPIYYIYGQVGRPGNYPIERGMTVGQAIAKGGSFTLRSRESGVRLLRRDKSGKIVESTPKLDDPMQPDDQIFVKESLF